MSRADVSTCPKDPAARQAYHESLKASRELFEAHTERLPHMPDVEAIQEGLLYRNCPRCRSTLTFELEPPPPYVCLPGMTGDEVVEWLRSVVGASSVQLERVTDFDLASPEAEALLDLEDFRRDGATVLDRVCSLVSDEMMAIDQAQREAAFAVPLEEPEQLEPVSL